MVNKLLAMNSLQNFKEGSQSIPTASKDPSQSDSSPSSLSAREIETLATQRHRNQIKTWIGKLGQQLNYLREKREKNPLSEDEVHELLESKRIRDAEFDQLRDPSVVREDLLSKLTKRLEDPKCNEHWMCLIGPEGTGKSAIVQKFARNLEAGRLGAAFFFPKNQGAESDITLKLITTIACQLSEKLPRYKDHIFNAIARDPFIFDVDLRTLFRKLIVDPSDLDLDRRAEERLVIIIDGLDQCGGIPEQLEILGFIEEYVKYTPSPPLMWLVSCRDKPHFRHTIQRSQRCHLFTLTTMSIFPGAQNFAIQGHAEFISVQNTHLNARTGPSGIDILLEASYPDAAVDAEAREYSPTCFPGTRKQYIHDVMHWTTASDAEGLLPIFWMRGPAGVGKSAIAQTCAEEVKELGQLGAAFFFSINGRNDHRRFFPTLAYQLSTVLPEFRDILDDKVCRDKTLVRKRMSSQFTSLVIEPLQELEKRGKGIRRMAIFIDGLDECQGNDAQSEIIKLIAASVREKRTPFRWAIFSRPEVHIKSTFDLENISPLCQHALLPISRGADGEIERYLKSGFKNILRRRGLLSLSDSWPTKGDVEKLVEASVGLFAYPAAVLRFVDCHSFLGYKETLQAVLYIIASRDKHPSRAVSPFVKLDGFYMLIVERIPKDMLPAVQLLLSWMFIGDGVNILDEWYFAVACNSLGFSELSLRGICQQLHAVLQYQDAPKQLDLGEGIDTTRSFFEQEIPSRRREQLKRRLRIAKGVVRLHHKSFYDSLVDPMRSSTFCVRTPVVLERFFNHLVKRHQQFAQSFLICSAGPTGYTLEASQPSIPEYLPQDNEFIRSFFQLDTFTGITDHLVHDSETLPLFLESLPSDCLSKLAGLDYRKILIADILDGGIGMRQPAQALNLIGVDRVLPGMLFSRIDPDEFKSFDSRAFLAMVQKLEKLGVFKPYHPNLPSTLASIPQMFSRLKHTKCSGRYKLGRGDKAVYWYWEFDVEEGYFHEFRALDFAKAMGIYEKEKFAMWDEDWVAPP